MTTKARKLILTEMKNAASTNSGRLFVIPWKSGWVVRKEGSFHITKIHSSKKMALATARTRRDYKGGIVLYERNGSIEMLKD